MSDNIIRFNFGKTADIKNENNSSSSLDSADPNALTTFQLPENSKIYVQMTRREAFDFLIAVGKQLNIELGIENEEEEIGVT